ncbi:AAA family ATPase [Virgibacillus sp. M23]|uniref:AAA family ATPase n=1 Tax=Virgibacillus sp. M23 TaxID=3079030 RepID=UPI002A913E53|nr:AAA family ATPase [Virgibacillus sp. M23]MDY7043612.1 AAA family ATPase [Virgibacillus sp. M23]
MGIFRKPSTKKLGLKVLLMGEKGVGKSVVALSFPRIYALDAETGMAFYENHPIYGKNLLGIANTQDFNELEEAIDELMDMGTNEVGTLVIDSETKFYQNLTDASLQVEEAKARKAGRDVMDSAVSMRGWGRIKAVAQRLQNLKIDLSAKGVNIISISQIDDVKQKVGDNFVKIGEKPVMQKGSEYDYDLVLKLYTEKNPKSGDYVYKSETLKDRTGVTQIGQVIENPTYEVWKEFVGGREGAEIIESSLSKDHDKAKKSLEKEDAKAEKPIADRLKDAMSLGDEQKEKATEMIKKAKIKNPLKPKDASEFETLSKIVETIENM